MTVHGDLERSVAMAEAAKGNYLLFGADSDDQKAKQVFKDMAEDMDRHVQILESRMQYLDQHNKLNAGGQQQQGDKQQGGDKQQKEGKKQNQDKQTGNKNENGDS